MTGEQIIQLARQLGGGLRDSETFQNYLAAKQEFRKDDTLREKLTEFKVQKQLLDKQAQLEGVDEAVLDAIGARAETLYREISDNPTYRKYQAAETAYNDLVGAVNATIDSFLADPDDSAKKTAQGSCSGNCAACRGCGTKAE